MFINLHEAPNKKFSCTMHPEQKEIGIRSCIRKLMVIAGNQNKRSYFAKIHKQCIKKQWKYVLWSDKIKLILFQKDEGVKLRLELGKAYNLSCIVSILQTFEGRVTI